MSLPIRLVERGGKVINLDCINYFITVKKTVPQLSVPVTGMRYALDANMVNAEIKLICILRDDDCSSADLDAHKSAGSIDFSSTSAGDDYLIGSASQTIANIADDLNGAQLQFQSTDTSTFTATFDTSTTSHTQNGNNITVGLGSLSDPVKGSDVASRIKTALVANTNFNNRFSIVAGNGRKASLVPSNERAAKLTFTQKVAGTAGDNFTPSFISPANNTDSTNNSATASPALVTFTGGSSNNCRSAGDKAQDILANVVNSNFTGLTGEGFFGNIPSTLVGGEASLGDHFEKFNPLGDLNHEDYVVGLQIPYNSLRHANIGSVGDPVQGYEPRNFLFITGHVDSNDQGSKANEKEASVAFDPTDKYTGISGTLVDCELKYEAGQTVYEVSLTFAPLDVILGI